MANDIKTIIVREGPTTTLSPQTVIINKGLRGDVGIQGAQGPQGPPGLLTVERVTLSSSDIASKGFNLSLIPMEPQKMELIPVGGITQVYGVDYTYINGKISWDGLGLDGFLEENEQIIVKY